MIVEKTGDLVGDDFHKLTLEDLDRFVGGGDAAVTWKENLPDVAFKNQSVAVGHVVDRELDVGVALVEGRTFVERKVVELDVDDSRRFDRVAKIFEIVPILLVDPIVDLLGADDVNVFDVGFQYFADAFADRARRASVAVLVRRRRTADDNDPLAFEILTLRIDDVAALPKVNACGEKRGQASGRRYDQYR